jgi:hypothetical protein
MPRRRWSFIRDARKLWHRLWSVRLSLLAALLSSVEVAWATYTSGQPSFWVVVAAVISLGAAIARLIAQQELHE